MVGTLVRSSEGEFDVETTQIDLFSRGEGIVVGDGDFLTRMSVDSNKRVLL